MPNNPNGGAGGLVGWVLNEEGNLVPRAPRRAPEVLQVDMGAIPVVPRAVLFEDVVVPGPRVRARGLNRLVIGEAKQEVKKVTRLLEITKDSVVKESFQIIHEPPRIAREGMLLSLVPKELPYDHCVGLEIEVEQAVYHPDPITSKLIQEAFDVVPDGSLRNGSEMVSKRGLTAGDVLSYVEVLDHSFNKAREGGGRRNSFSFRCGLHVHVDVTLHTMEELYRAFLVYTLVERLLFKISGERGANKFCVSVQDSATCISNALYYGHVGDWKTFSETVFHGSKYMAMNIRPVRSRGSIEFRHHEGTSNPEKIKNWLLVLLDVVCGSRRLYTVQLEQAIIDVNTTSEYEELLLSLLPNSHNILKVGKFEKDLYAGVVFIKEAFLASPEVLPHQGVPE